jgi:nucleotide-binding universal stress UspA family protein
MASMAKRAPEPPHAIVLGTDFSTGSQIAQARAAELSLRYRAALHVVHAGPRIPRALARRFSSVTEGKLREALDAVVAELRDAGVDAHAHSSHLDPVKALTAKARAVAADLVVVGTRGGSVLKAMIGSTAERLIASDQHRVLLVRRPSARAYRKTVIAASEESRLREQVAAAAFISNKTPTVLHAYEAPYESRLILHGASVNELSRHRASARHEAKLRMGKLMAKLGLERLPLVLHHGSPFRLLERFDPDSLIVLSRGKSQARRLFFGSVTRAVVAYGRSDVLLV